VHDPPVLLWTVLGLLAIERAFELGVNRRNSRVLRENGARWHGPRDGFGLIVAAQALLFAGTLFEGTSAAWGGVKPWTWYAIAGLALAQALRYWCIGTLGWRWSVRVVTVPGAPRIAEGPYRYFPHPNYVAVMLEAVLLPLAFGAYATLLVAAPVQLAALWRRVRIEETALNAAEAGAPRVE